MNSLKKIIFLGLIPVFLTAFFIVQFTIPGVKEYFKLEKQIKSENMAIEELQNNVEGLRKNKKLLNALNKLNTELADYEIEFPSEFKDEILLVDLELFANESVNKITKVTSQSEKEIDINNPLKQSVKKKTRNSKKQKNEEEKPLISIMEKTFEINTIAYYSEVIDFISFLENYQRKIYIEGIHTEVFSDDKSRLNPRVELIIKGSIYKSAVNEKKKKLNENPDEQQVKTKSVKSPE
ncbi:MAG TPA: hypothetical protein P5556_00230 [Candidatus Gastranaerophilales bacterium]|nr:hypothetical protein [Candidatus Gastranaerophilales bacterium]